MQSFQLDSWECMAIGIQRRFSPRGDYGPKTLKSRRDSTEGGIDIEVDSTSRPPQGGHPCFTAERPSLFFLKNLMTKPHSVLSTPKQLTN